MALKKLIHKLFRSRDHLAKSAKQDVGWMPMDLWDKCNFAIDCKNLEGRACYGGLDFSAPAGLVSFVLVFPPENKDDKYQILPYFWIPIESLRLRERRTYVPYDVWAKQGFLRLTRGNVINYKYVYNFIYELGKRYNIREIAFDRWGSEYVVQELEKLRFSLVRFGQGYKDMSPPTKELMYLTQRGQLAHGGNPVLRWNMVNVHIRKDPAGNIKPDKEKSAEAIGSVAALIMALDRALKYNSAPEKSVSD